MDCFRLDARAAERVLDQAFTIYRPRIEAADDGFDAASVVNGLTNSELGEELTLEESICCIAYYALLDDVNLYRPPGFRFHKALEARVVASWDGEPGVAAQIRHESDPGRTLLGSPRPASEIYPDAVDRWRDSRAALQQALETIVGMGNELLALARTIGRDVAPR